MQLAAVVLTLGGLVLGRLAMRPRPDEPPSPADCADRQDGPRRIVLRSPWASLAISVIGSGGLLVGLTYLTDTGSGVLTMVIFGVPPSAVGAWFMVRPWFARVVVTSEKVVLHGMFRRQEIARSEIAAVTRAIVDGVLGPARTVGFVVAEDKVVAVESMASYQWGRGSETGRAARQVAAARSVLGL